MNVIQEASVSTQTSEKSKSIDFGNGRYSNLMKEVHSDAQTVFKISSPAAEKLARQVASDLGAIMAAAPVDVRLGKLNKDGKLTISEASKVKNVTMKDSITALKALQYAGESGKNGFSFGRTDWIVTEVLSGYLASL